MRVFAACLVLQRTQLTKGWTVSIGLTGRGGGRIGSGEGYLTLGMTMKD